MFLYDYPMGFMPVTFLDKIEYAQFLHDGSELALQQPIRHGNQSGDPADTLGGFLLPMKKPADDVPVVECWIKD